MLTHKTSTRGRNDEHILQAYQSVEGRPNALGQHLQSRDMVIMRPRSDDVSTMILKTDRELRDVEMVTIAKNTYSITVVEEKQFLQQNRPAS